MSPRAGWDPRTAVSGCPVLPWTGSVWRAHKRTREATDHGGSLLVSGRWHVAAADPGYSSGPTWPALYTSLDLAVCAFEVQRIITRGGGCVGDLRAYRYSEVWVQLSAVIDCRDAAVLGLEVADLIREGTFETPRAIALAARDLGAEAMLVPSASSVGDNLIIFPDRRRAGSVLEVIRSLDPKLGHG